jgi:hypothetical protein
MSSNGGVLEEIAAILEHKGQDAISPEVVNRLLLSSMLDLTRRMKEVEKVMPALRLIMWVGAAIGASVIAFIWSLITGQASVTF